MVAGNGVERFTVTRSNGVEVEVLRGLLRHEAARIVDRDTSAGFVSWMAVEVHGFGNGTAR